MDTKIFYPWNLDKIDSWMRDNESRYEFLGQTEQDYRSKKNNKRSGKQITVYYKRKD